MGTAIQVPVVPETLDWAIRTSGIPLKDVARRLKVTRSALEAWLDGVSVPTLTQANRLAQILHRDLAVLLLPAPPSSTTPAPRFRHSKSGRTKLLPSELIEIRKAARLQQFVSWIASSSGQKSVGLKRLTKSSSPEKAAKDFRNILNVDVATQQAWRNSSEALKGWRGALERLGILVFLLPLGKDGSRGFSLWDGYAPVVAANTAWNQEARIYTLFHEVGHLLTRTDSVCAQHHVTKKGKDIEQWCESFAAAALLPWNAVRAFLGDGSSYDLNAASKLARRFKVSLRAAVLRLINKGKASWTLYRAIPPYQDRKKSFGGGRPETSAERRVRVYGKRSNKMILRGLDRDIITVSDALNHLALPLDDLGTLKTALR